MTEEEVIRELNKTNNDKTPGPDEIQYEHVKHAHAEMIKALTNLFNAFWKKGHVPKDLKKTYLTLLYKKGPREYVKSWRPITLLSVILKLYEKCLESRTKDVLRLSGGIHPLQGYAKKAPVHPKWP